MIRRAHLFHPVRLARICSLAVAAGLSAAAAEAQQDLKRLSIEELMRIDVTTAARREQPVGTAPAAMSVITGDDIRRAGVTTIADALRIATGVHVARFNSGTWRISARGFNGGTPNKLLVMVDGRTVYSPLFAGVFWNTLDYVLEDIDRIEVIRGPGTVLWGTNAVNGVVNIITRHSRDTQGVLATLTAGDEDPLIAQVRYGAQAGAGAGTWRVYGKVALRDNQKLATGESSGDRIRRAQGGFRVDRTAGGADWLVQGDVFHSRIDFPDRDDGEFSDVALQGRWSRTFGDTSRLDLRSYYRHEHRRVPLQLTHRIDVVDVDAQHTTRWGSRQEIVWGGGLRFNRDRTEGSEFIRFEPPARNHGLQNLFVQDEITILPGRLAAILGLKFEHNAFSGGELQPNLRARLTMARNQVLWAGFSRAVRRPTRFDDDLVVSAPGGLTVARGTGEFEGEKLHAFEAGYRVQPIRALSFDATLFLHDYDDLRSQDAPATGVLPVTIGNTLEGRSRGVEISANVQPVEWWRSQAGYTFLDTRVSPQPGSRDTTGGASETNDPDHILFLRTSVDLPRDVEVDAIWRAVSALPNPATPGYTELTLRGGWRPRPSLDLFVVGEDLLHPRHAEVALPTGGRVEFERSLRVGITVSY